MLRSYHYAKVTSLTALAVALCATGVRAHPAPAQPPEFGSTECIVVANKDVTTTLHFQYVNPSDDTQLTAGDIAVPDAKTHQFFAFRGLLRSFGVDRNLYPFAVDDAAVTTLPVWITRADVQRSATAGNVSDATGFTESNVPLESVLETNIALQDKWLRITADDRRVPITIEQGFVGFDWDIGDVVPGIYTIAGYIFSPPFNGWEPRAGLIKVVDAANDPPAVMLDRTAGFVYSYQGRLITGCVDAPEGSTLRAQVRVEERPEQGWRTFAENVPAPSGRLELCFTPSADDRSGTALIRVDITTPDGRTLSGYSPDTLTLLQGTGECVESATVCCPARPPTAAQGGTGSTAGAGAAPPRIESSTSSGGGCNALPGPPAPAWWWLGLVILARRRFQSRCGREH